MNVNRAEPSRHGLRLLPEDGRVKVLRGVGSAEALGDWMGQPEEGPRVAHLLFIEELTTLLTRGGWEGSTLLSFLTETFDTPDLYEVPFRKNFVKVHEPTPTLIAGTTPEWFWKGLRELDVHGGFGNRLFFLTGTPKGPIPLPAKPGSRYVGEVRECLNRLDGIPPTELVLADDAVPLWNQFYIDWKQRPWEPLTGAAVKRIPAYIMKLAMVYAGFEDTIPAIRKEQLAAAIEVGQYGAHCADQLMQRHRNRSTQGQCEERILSALERDDLPSWQIHRRIGGRFSAEELNRALKALVQSGVVITVECTRRNEPVYRRRRCTPKRPEV